MNSKILSVPTLFILSLIVLACTPPANVQKAFALKFPQAANIEWGKENSREWEAEFIVDDVKVSANFSTEGVWMETETEIPVSEIPPNVLTALNTLYPNRELTNAFKIEGANSQTKYEIEIKTKNSKEEVEFFEDGTKVE